MCVKRADSNLTTNRRNPNAKENMHPMWQHLRPRQPCTALLSDMRNGKTRSPAKGKEREGQTATP